MSKKFADLHFNIKLLISEMERRGIKVDRVGDTNTIIAKLKNHQEIIDNADLSVMPASLKYLMDHKWNTKQLLQKLKIPTAAGRVFKQHEMLKASQYAKKLFPVVLKPASGCHGYGVRPHIDSLQEFEIEFERLTKFLNPPSDILVEKHINGAEFRLSVTRNGFFAAVHRACPKVIGDGKSSILELIAVENYRRTHPRDNCLCEIWTGDGEVDRYLKKKGLNVKSVPRKNDTVYLRANTNISTGAECIDVTDLVHPFYKKFAFEVLNKIKGLPYCGLDLITEDIGKYTSSTKYTVCEINPSPGISLHTHPSSGRPRPFDKALIDLIFPETAKPLYVAKPRAVLLTKKHANLAEILKESSLKLPDNWWFKPASIEVEITNKCSLKCPGCAIIEDIEKAYDGFNLEKILDVLKQASSTSIYSYNLTGGEPFLKLKDLCEIIKKSPIDLFKIQTNCTVFSSEKMTQHVLLEIKKAGFGSKNKFLKPTINCSIGMQNEAGANLRNVAILTNCFFKIFSNKATLAINVLPYKDADADKYLEELEQQHQKLFKKKFPFEKIRLHQMQMEWTKRLAENKMIDTGLTTIKEKIESLGYGYRCFNFDISEVDSPIPRILVRADGTVYPCSCFGHVSQSGNINKESLYSILERIQDNKLLHIVEEQGLPGLLAFVRKSKPNIDNIKIPKTLSVCKTCKMLRESNFN